MKNTTAVSGQQSSRWQKMIGPSLLALAISQTGIAQTDNKRNDSPVYLPNDSQLIVKFKHNSAAQDKQHVLQSTLQRLSKQSGIQLNVKRSMASGAELLEVSSKNPKLTVKETINLLKNDPNVEYAVENYRMYPVATPNDTRYNEQWHYFENTGGINAPAAWDLNKGNGAVVAVIDTGYRPHADLAANIIGGYDFISDSGTARDGDGRDANAEDEGDWFGFFECPGAPFNSTNSSWHGTHVAGTIGAVTDNSEGVAGIAYEAKIVPVRVLGKCGGTLADIQEGMLWAAGISVSGVPDNTNPADVINLSLGGGAACDAAMQDAVNQITAAGTLVVAAAGNSNADASGFTPASCDNVLTVASTNRNGSKAGYSNYGSVVEVAAPGGETSGGAAGGVLSTLNTGAQGPEQDSYAFYQGTSMAAPHAAGVAALLYSYKPDATPEEVTNAMMTSARAFPGSCNQCGAGIIDAHAALLAIGGGGNQAPNASFSAATSGLTATFTDGSSDSDGTIASWSWDFGDGNTSTAQNPSHTYSAAGTYAVSLTVTDNEGASDSFSQNVSVSDSSNQSPVADFSFTVSDLTVTFDDRSVDPDGTIASWSWDFGDGNTSTAASPTHTFGAAGTYTVSLTVTDNDGASNTMSESVTVTDPPGGDITISLRKSSFWIIHTVYVDWQGANGTNVDIYRNGSLRTTTANDGSWSETIWGSGSRTYKVCEAGTQNCSEEKTINL